jgi:hypothetical protein
MLVIQMLYNPRPGELILLPLSTKLHCKKRLVIFPSLAGMSLTNVSLSRINKVNPRQGELVSDIPAGDGKIDKVFYSVVYRQVVKEI